MRHHSHGNQESATLAGKAQVYLNETLRVLKTYEHLIPEDLMEDYQELKKTGVMQMSRIFALMFESGMMSSGISGELF